MSVVPVLADLDRAHEFRVTSGATDGAAHAILTALPGFIGMVRRGDVLYARLVTPPSLSLAREIVRRLR